MVSSRRTGIAAGAPTFVTVGEFPVGTTCVLDEHAARHIRVLRLQAGAEVGLRNGAGMVGQGQLVRITRTQAYVEVLKVEQVAPPPPVHLLLPVADRDRMLWLAEKAGELGCTSWRPVIWRRSRSVSPRGEGRTFQLKVRTRMEQAMAQSEGAWLPALFPEANLERALLAAPEGVRLVLEAGGAPLTDIPAVASAGALVIALGPEGGIEDDELAALTEAGFTAASLGPGILRFETAGTVALGLARTLLAGRSAV